MLSRIKVGFKESSHLIKIQRKKKQVNLFSAATASDEAKKKTPNLPKENLVEQTKRRNDFATKNVERVASQFELTLLSSRVFQMNLLRYFKRKR